MDDLDRLLRVTGGEAPLEDLEARVWRRVGILERTREGVTMRVT